MAPKARKRQGARAKGYAGGPSTAGGIGFQHEVAAWIATLILAETEATPQWGLGAAVTLEALDAETDHPIDDLAVEASADHRVFIQVKTGLSLAKSRRAASGGRLAPLASVIDQVVRFNEAGGGTQARSNRPDPILVLVAGPGSKGTITEDLRKALDRLRTQSPQMNLMKAGVTPAEKRALTIVIGHARQSWKEMNKSKASDTDLRALLQRLQIDSRAAKNADYYEADSKRLLRTTILVEPAQADLAWNTLVSFGASLAANRHRADRAAIRDSLTKQGIALRAAPSYRADIAVLQHHSDSVQERLRDFMTIQLGTTAVEVKRAVAAQLTRLSGERSCLIVGTPGSGKSGALLSVVAEHRQRGHDVVVFDASALAGHSVGILRTELGLVHEIVDVLANWPGPEPAFFVVDALDAARGEYAAHTLREIIDEIRRRASRWRIMASIREYELRHNPDLARLFPAVAGSPSATAIVPTAPGLERVAHVLITDFDTDELRQVAHQAPALGDLITTSPPRLASLLRNPFNLRLAAELLDGGTNPEELHGVRLRVQLLDRFWMLRVVSWKDALDADARESVLRSACRSMVDERRLVVNRAALTSNPAAGRSLGEILRAHVLREFTTSPTALPDSAILVFSHHVLFDYAVARLLLRGTPETLSGFLTADPDAVLTVRPSIVMHFEWLWIRDSGDHEHRAFWNAVFTVLTLPDLRPTVQLIGPTVAAELAVTEADLSPLTESLRATVADERLAGERALQHVVGALVSTTTLARSPS
jgi:hypothetical protein